MRRCRTLEFDDLVAAGREGILHAVDKFDPALGNKFLTYAAWWVRAKIEREIANADATIRIPVHLVDAARQVFHGTFKGSEAKRKAVMDAAATWRPLSLDAPSSDDGRPLHDVIASGEVGADDLLDEATVARSVRSAIGRVTLTDREKVIVEYRLMGEATLEDVAQQFGLSRERIRQIEVKLREKLRLALESEAGQ